MKGIICHLPNGTPEEDMSNELVTVGFIVINVQQITSDHCREAVKSASHFS
jgi:hypothetical protein